MQESSVLHDTPVVEEAAYEVACLDEFRHRMPTGAHARADKAPRARRKRSWSTALREHAPTRKAWRVFRDELLADRIFHPPHPHAAIVMLTKTHAQKERRLLEQHLEPERGHGLAEGDDLEAGLVVVESSELVSLALATGGVSH